MAEDVAAGDQRYLTFRSDDRLYALPAVQVAEVIRPTALARVPLAPDSLLGLANLRGAVMPVASIRSLLGLAQANATSASRLIVLDGAAPVALEVDAVATLVNVPASAILAGDSDTGLSAVAG